MINIPYDSWNIDVDMEVIDMRMPGFNAEASCYTPDKSYRLSASYSRHRAGTERSHRYSVVPAQDILLIETDAPAEGPEDVCKELEKCCKEGYIDCCEALKGCR